MCKKTHILILLLLAWAHPAFSHPVAFKGAWAFMAFNQPDMQDWQLLYSFERKFSLGVDFFHDTMEPSANPEGRHFLIPRLSWLVNRWYGKDYQANIYVYGGVGAARKGNITETAGEGAVETDYETRSVYFSAKAQWVAARNFETLAIYQARAGLAPYEGAFDEIQTWLIAQAQYLPFAPNEKLRVGPVLRVFYRNVLGEVGISAQGSWNMNFMVHF